LAQGLWRNAGWPGYCGCEGARSSGRRVLVWFASLQFQSFRNKPDHRWCPRRRPCGRPIALRSTSTSGPPAASQSRYTAPRRIYCLFWSPVERAHTVMTRIGPCLYPCNAPLISRCVTQVLQHHERMLPGAGAAADNPAHHPHGQRVRVCLILYVGVPSVRRILRDALQCLRVPASQAWQVYDGGQGWCRQNVERLPERYATHSCGQDTWRSALTIRA
jgi:hypothetical protein